MTLGLAERWINTRLAQVITTVTGAIHNYRLDLAAQAVYDFTWDDYCDWYLELSKTTLTHTAATEAQQRGTLYTLVQVLEQLLRLLHPFIPFITEELWRRVSPVAGKGGNTIMLQPYPDAALVPRHPDSVPVLDWVKAFILGVRRIRAERDIAPGKPLPVSIKGGNDQERGWLREHRNYLCTLAKITEITMLERAPDDAVMALAGDMTILVPLAELIDLDAERERLRREHVKLDKLVSAYRAKLGNENFIARAPAEVINKERGKMAEAEAALVTISREIERIEKLRK